jgi:hypothetical protein
MIEKAITVPLRYSPHIAVEELDRDDVVVRIVTTSMNPRDGATLAEQVLTGLRTTDGAHGDHNGGANGHHRQDDGGGGQQPA